MNTDKSLDANPLMLTPEEAKTLTLKFAEEKLPEFIEMLKTSLKDRRDITFQERNELLLQFLEDNLDFRSLKLEDL